MCTVTVIPLRFASPRGHEPIHGFRLVTSRDENRTRPEADPPRWRSVASPSRRALYPTDGGGGHTAVASGGTWVAASDMGLVLCLLNGNPRPYPSLPPAERMESRGVIVPRLIDQPSAEAAAGAVASLNLDAFAPFALLAVDLPHGPPGETTRSESASEQLRAFRVRWNRRELVCERYSGSLVCAVSSGLGDDLVQPRLALFESMVQADGPRPDTQDRFHRHVWRDRPEISVLMSRRDARTVSVTTVEVVAARHASPARISMRYQPIREGGGYGHPVIHRTAIEPAAAVSGRVRVPVVASEQVAV
jgi:hypothetical protein